MSEVLFNGHAGRLEGRYHQSDKPGAPIALILHPHPQYGGTMNNKVVYTLFSCFEKLGFSVLRFNFRSVGRSQGEFEDGPGELSDATVALDWLQSVNPEARQCWIAGYSFGAWIGLQLLMRRPDINNFISNNKCIVISIQYTTLLYEDEIMHNVLLYYYTIPTE